MKYKNSLLVMTGFIVLALAPGCGRVVDWGVEKFDQGGDLPPLPKNADAYIRSVTLYNQFATAGMFDAMWLSDDTRIAHADMYMRRRGKSEEDKNVFLRRQLEDNKHSITFYVLSPFELPLGQPQSQWQMFLTVDDVSYSPLEVKSTELDPEYRVLFGKKISRFKEAYVVRFNATTTEDKPIISSTSKEMVLHFRSAGKEGSMVWRLHEGAKVTEKQESGSMSQDLQTQAKELYSDVPAGAVVPTVVVVPTVTVTSTPVAPGAAAQPAAAPDTTTQVKP
ncbi:MAG: hypothetical protein NTX86_01810 [Candidatus Dependentiae bacterium]|nr:hypothetical protein [Candidatus Dependentiae bacterium]